MVSGEVDKCDNCQIIERNEFKLINQKKSIALLPAKLKAPISSTNPLRVKLTLQNQRMENKILLKEMEEMKLAIKNYSVSIQEDIHTDFRQLFSQHLERNNVPPFMKLFWEEQQKYLSSPKNGIRYHPMIIRYCLNLASKSPAVYEEMRFNEKSGSGCLILPSRRRLRDYKNYITPERGFNPKILTELLQKTAPFQLIEKYVIITFDEMKIQDKLVWDKHSGDLIGYVDLGDSEVNCATLKNTESIATHVLVFLIRGIVNPFKFPLANFATSSATSIQIFNLFWKAVGIVEKKGFLKVMAVTCDGASANRKFFQIHRYFQFNRNHEVIYKTQNLYSSADENRYIYFISDTPHLIKTERNCLSKSGSTKGSRYMWNDNIDILWSHSRFFYEDMELGLHLLPKLSHDHINLTSFSVMNVKLATQILSSTVAKVVAVWSSGGSWYS